VLGSSSARKLFCSFREAKDFHQRKDTRAAQTNLYKYNTFTIETPPGKQGVSQVYPLRIDRQTFDLVDGCKWVDKVDCPEIFITSPSLIELTYKNIRPNKRCPQTRTPEQDVGRQTTIVGTFFGYIRRVTCLSCTFVYHCWAENLFETS
jgi:hypothetical protein